MPDVPENMQENIAQLEDQVLGSNIGSNLPSSNKSSTLDANSGYNQSYTARSGKERNSNLSNISSALPDPPNFSPFPVLRDLPPNVPPSDEQKEATLDGAREAVLASNDPEMQLTWAQDVLAYVEVAMQNEQRVSITQPPRAQTPRIEHTLREDAVKIVSFLAEQHHPKAEFLQGMWREFGKFGYRVDKKEAFRCYSRALEKGYARASYRIGMQFEQSNEPLKAITYYRRGVDAADSAACWRLGMMALSGQHGQLQDYERGLNLLYSSAQTADENAPQGAYVFGMLQARQLTQVSVPDRFLPADMNGAKVNIEKAAYLGFAKAQVKMASAYELCDLGCGFSPALSLHYNVLAARQGEPDAEMAISKWFLCGYEGLFEKNEEIAFIYAQRAAHSGLATAQFALGYFYEVGIHVPMDLKEAREWYSKAAANGNQDAAGRIESISRSKTISRKDHERIALSKIRQQHGSYGQGAGDALPVPSIPAMPPPIDMPDPARLSSNPRPYGGYLRPPNEAPYPSTEPDQVRPVMPGPNYSNPEFRPTSAFGINPNLRPASAAAAGGVRPDDYGPNPGQYLSRPYSSSDIGGYEYQSNNQLPAGSRPQEQLQPRPYAPGSYSGGLSSQNQTPPPSMKIDIGYSAPLDSAAGRQKQHNLPSQGSGEVQRPPRTSSNLSANLQRPPRTTSTAPANTRPPRNDGPSQSLRPSQTSTGNPLPPTAGNKPATLNDKPSTTPASARPPGKGPKTFEEMGVPQGKAGGDCVSGFISNGSVMKRQLTIT